MKWSIDQFHVEHPDRWDDPMRQPGTISRDLLREQNSRKPHWSFTEPAPAPQFAETNPFAGEVAPETAETKPLSPAVPPENDETKPFVRVGLIGSLADAVPQLIVVEAVVVHHSGTEPGCRGRREGRISPAQEAAKRQKAAQRRAALGCGAGV